MSRYSTPASDFGRLAIGIPRTDMAPTTRSAGRRMEALAASQASNTTAGSSQKQLVQSGLQGQASPADDEGSDSSSDDTDAAGEDEEEEDDDDDDESDDGGDGGEDDGEDKEKVINQIMAVFNPYGLLSPREFAQVNPDSNHARYV